MLHSKDNFSSSAISSNGEIEFQRAYAVCPQDVWIKEKPAFSEKIKPHTKAHGFSGQSSGQNFSPGAPPLQGGGLVQYTTYTTLQGSPACLHQIFLQCLPPCTHKPLFSIPLPFPKHPLGHRWVGERMYLHLGT